VRIHHSNKARSTSDDDHPTPPHPPHPPQRSHLYDVAALLVDDEAPHHEAVVKHEVKEGRGVAECAHKLVYGLPAVMGWRVGAGRRMRVGGRGCTGVGGSTTAVLQPPTCCPALPCPHLQTAAAPTPASPLRCCLSLSLLLLLLLLPLPHTPTCKPAPQTPWACTGQSGECAGVVDAPRTIKSTLQRTETTQSLCSPASPRHCTTQPRPTQVVTAAGVPFLPPTHPPDPNKP